MIIRECNKYDTNSVNDLMDKVGFTCVDSQMFDDFTIGAFDGDKCLGFIWAMISESRFIAYVDFLAVEPGTMGIGTRITQEMWSILNENGVRKVMSLVKYSGTENEEKSLQLNYKLGMIPLSKPYHLCIGDTDKARF